MSKRIRKARFTLPQVVPLPTNYRLEDPNKGVMDGLPYADPNTLTAYASKRDPYAMAHEVGHILDEQLTDADRRRFQRIMRMKGPWEQGTGVHGGYHSPSESFADYYAAAATRLDLNHSNVGAYTQFNKKRLRRFKKALDRLGREQGLRQYGSDGVGGRLPNAQGPMASQIAQRI